MTLKIIHKTKNYYVHIYDDIRLKLKFPLSESAQKRACLLMLTKTRHVIRNINGFTDLLKENECRYLISRYLDGIFTLAKKHEYP